MVANISSVTNTLVNNAANVKNLKEASEVGRGGLQEVAQDIQEITGGMNEMASGAEQINVAVHNVNEMTLKNRLTGSGTKRHSHHMRLTKKPN
jgi:methyl-accepting chemotaxis protein